MTDPTQPTPVSTTSQEPGTVTAEDIEVLRGELASAQARRDRYIEAGYEEFSSEIVDVDAAIFVAEARLQMAEEVFNIQGARTEEGAALAAIETPRTGNVPEDSADMVFTEEEVATSQAATESGEESSTQETPQPEERASSRSSDNANPPNVFQELSNQALYQDYLVFINGINVTRWVVGSVTYQLAGRGGTNTASFQLANPDNLFIMIPNEDAGGSIGGNIPPPSGGAITPNSLSWRTAETNTMQSEHPMYSEIVKKETYLRKALSPLQISETIGTQSLEGGQAQEGNAVQITRPGGDPRSEAGFDLPNMERWPFGYHRTPFHKHDPVRIFVHNPFTPDDDSWICAFTGYIQNYPVDDDWIMGNSSINISCYCLKALMQKMRIQTNQLLYELPGDVAVNEGFFADFMRESEGGESLHRMANQTYENIASYILTGRFLAEWFDGYQDQSNTSYVLSGSSIMRERFSTIGIQATIQDLEGGGGSPTTNFAVPSEATSSSARIERTTEGVGQVSMGSVFKFPGELSSQEDKANFIQEWHKLSLFGGFRRPLTYREALQIGAETKVDGNNPPDRVNVHMLIPSMGSGLGTLEQIGIDTQTQEGRREFATRYDMLDGYSEKIDFQWWTNGIGNIMVEMPMYDWFPSDFGEWEPVFTVDAHAISSNMGDESGDPPTAVIARGDQTGHANIQAGGDMDNWVPRLGMAWAPTMVHRYGVTPAEINLPFVTDPAVLRARALLELQKRLAEANQFSADFICRPLLVPNRPIYFKPRERLGWTQSVSNSMSVLGECTTQAELNYTRHRDINGTWRHITGGSFSALRYGQVVTGSGEGAALAFPGSEESDSAENFPVTCNSAIIYTTQNRGEGNCESQPNSPTARAAAAETSDEPDDQPRESEAEDPEEPEDADKLVVYISNDISEFSIRAHEIARMIDADIEGYSSASEMRSVIEQREPESLSQFIMCAHGSPQWCGKGRTEGGRGGEFPQGMGVSTYYARDFFPKVMKLSTLVQILGPRLVDNAIISLCACSCGKNPDSRRNPSVNDLRLNGGLHSFAATLRNEMGQAGKPVQIRAHTASGHVTFTAYCRYFTSTIGSEGISVGQEAWGRDVILYSRRITTPDGTRYGSGNYAWSKGLQRVNGRTIAQGKFWGEAAARWMAGNPVDDSVVAQRPEIPS